jgi:hypothetical protein
MTPLCQDHFEKYNRVLPLIDLTDYPEETIDARLKYLYRVKNRDTKLLDQLDKEKPPKIENVTAEIIALVGSRFKGLSFVNISYVKSKDKVTAIHERIAADLRDCINQISEFEALKQNKNNNSSNLVVSDKEHEMEVMREARSKLEALDPNNNKSIDAKEFLNGQIAYLPEPYLIVRDNPTATFQNVMGITFNNLAAVVNILAREHNYKIISTACDNHTMYVFMEKVGSLR